MKTVSISQKSGISPPNTRSEYLLLILALSLFIFIQLSALLFHEPWTDEIQAWLLARDSQSLWELLWVRLRYEATPGLWHTILRAASYFSTDVSVLNICGSVVATLSCALILFASPLPLWVRLLLPFSYYFGYQYSIVARNYCLTSLGVLIAAVIYPQRLKHPLLYVLALVVVANSCAHGILLASAIALSDLPLKKDDWTQKASLLKQTPVFIVGVVAAILQMLPLPKDIEPAGRPPISSWQAVIPSLDQSLLGVLPLSLLVLIASLLLFHKAKVLSPYLVSIGFLEVFFVAYYWSYWHSGLLFLIWTFCLFQCYETKHPATNKAWWRLSLLLFLIVSVLQTAKMIQLDTLYPFSGLERAAQDLKRRNIEVASLGYADYNSLMLRAYFPPAKDKPSYWIWSKSHNSTWLIASALASSKNVSTPYSPIAAPFHPKYALCSDSLSVDPLEKLGYKAISRYQGVLCWRAKILITNGYILLERN